MVDGVNPQNDSIRRKFGSFLTNMFSTSGMKAAQHMTLPRVQSERQFREEVPESWHDTAYWDVIAPRYGKTGGVGFVTPPYIAYWDRIWGVTPIEDLAKYKEMYIRVPFIKSAIDITVALAVGRGFELIGDEEVVDFIKQWMTDLHILDLTKIIATDMLTFGNAYLEVVRLWRCDTCDFSTSDKVQMWRHLEENLDHFVEDDKGTIVNLKPHDPSWIRVRRDPYGTIYGYIQFLTFPLVSFMSDEIVQFKFSSKSWDYESAYGTSLLRALLRIEALIDEMETILGIIYYTYTKPMLLVHVGDIEHSVTAEQYTEVIDQFTNRKQASDIFVRGDVVSKVDVIQSMTQNIDVYNWLDYLERQREYALMPFSVITGRTGGNKTNQEVARQLYTSQLRIVQEEIGAKFTDFLLRPLVEKYFPGKTVPRVQWKPVLDPDMSTLLAMASRGFEDTLMTRNEARAIMGMPHLDEKFGEKGDELFKPEDVDTKAKIPGANEEGLPRPAGRQGRGMDDMKEELMREMNNRIGDLPEVQPYRTFQRRDK